MIEYNSYFSASEAKTVRRDEKRAYDSESGYCDCGASAAALEKLGRSKGYMLVGYTDLLNLFFVRDDLAHGKFERLPVPCVPAEPRHAMLHRERFADV